MVRRRKRTIIAKNAMRMLPSAVGLSVCREIVHEEARANEERDFKQICAFPFSREGQLECNDTYRRATSRACWSTDRGA
jgi:hypothetical protein